MRINIKFICSDCSLNKLFLLSYKFHFFLPPFISVQLQLQVTLTWIKHIQLRRIILFHILSSKHHQLTIFSITLYRTHRLSKSSIRQLPVALHHQPLILLNIIQVNIIHRHIKVFHIYLIVPPTIYCQVFPSKHNCWVEAPLHGGLASRR